MKFGYKSRLEQDLPRWEREGWVTEAGGRAIRSELAASPGLIGLAPVLAILGGILLLFGVMLFVAANWDAMSRLMRLVLLIGAMWAAYATAGALLQRGHEAFAQAAILVGCGLFGANIMLIAQLYHIEGDPPDGVLTWAVGSGLAAVLLRSNPGFGLTTILIGLWAALETTHPIAVFWPYLGAWAAVFAAVALTTRSRWVLHLLALSLAFWVIHLGYVLNDGHRHDLVTGVGLVVMALMSLGGPEIDRYLAVSRPGLVYGLVVAFAGLYGMQFIEGLFYTAAPAERWFASNGLPLAVLAGAALALVLGCLFWGARTDNRPLLWVSYVCFSLEILSLYFRTLGTMLDTSLFFLLAGALVIGLSWVAFRLHKGHLVPAES